MDILPTWFGRVAALMLVFPVVMLVLPYTVASIRQKAVWNKAQPSDVFIGHDMIDRRTGPIGSVNKRGSRRTG